MTEEQHHETPHSDHAAHTAPAEPHPLPKNLWQRWMAWSGSFLVLSILVHVVLLGGATVLVVQVVQGRKEKMKFTAPPPSAAGGGEHKVKPSKKTAAAAPAVSKRIASTAANASIALPAMDMSSSTGPDVMASVMSGLGSAGLGSGAGGAGGMASMPLAGLTAFGFKGGGRTDGLVGRLYDLKQTKDRQSTDIKDDGFWINPHQVDGMDFFQRSAFINKVLSDPSQHSLVSPSILNEAKLINNFLGGSWDEKVLLGYYRSQDPMVAYQWSIPMSSPKDAVKAFGVESEVKPTHIIIHYKGFVTAPRDMTVRFLCQLRGGVIAVRFDNNNVLFSSYGRTQLLNTKTFEFKNDYPTYKSQAPYSKGKWFKVRAGEKYPVEIFISIGEGGFGCNLMMEEMNPPKPYEPSEWQWQTKQGRQYQTEQTLKDPHIYLRYPLFALRKGVPSVPFTMPGIPTPPTNPSLLESWKRDGPTILNADVASEPLVFPGAK